jgi:hypothetical protein
MTTPERWQSINQDVDTLTTPYVLIERILSKSKHLAPTAALLMKEHLNTIINGEFWKAAQYAIDTLRIERLSHFTNLQQWVTEEIPLSDIKLRLQSTANITQERRSCIGSFDSSFDSMCERVEALSRSQVGLKSSFAPRINAIEHEEDNQGSRYQKNGRGLAHGARYHKHDMKEEEGDHEAGHHRKNDWFGRNKEHNNKWSNSRGKWSDKQEDNRYGKGGRKNRFGKGGKGWTQRGSSYHKKSDDWKDSGKGGKGGKRHNNSNSFKNDNSKEYTERLCTWRECREGPPHSIKECPVRAQKPCTFNNCHVKGLHYRYQCAKAGKHRNEAGQDHQIPYENARQRNNRPQVNYISDNRQLAHQLEENYQSERAQGDGQNRQ